MTEPTEPIEPPYCEHFISVNDQCAGVAFLRGLADHDIDAMNIANAAVDNPWAVSGQFAGIIVQLVRFIHEHDLGPPLDEVLTAWGIESALAEYQ